MSLREKLSVNPMKRWNIKDLFVPLENIKGETMRVSSDMHVSLIYLAIFTAIQKFVQGHFQAQTA